MYQIVYAQSVSGISFIRYDRRQDIWKPNNIKKNNWVQDYQRAYTE
jgi:hypothetical protein